MTIGSRLRNERLKRHLTQWDVVRAVGLGSNVVLSRYENDERTPDPETLRKLADFYRVSTDYLLGRTDDPSPPGRQAPPPEKTPDEQFEGFLRGRGLSQDDIELIKMLEERRHREKLARERKDGQ